MDRTQAILNGLLSLYPNAKPELNYESPFQLLIAAILSAQCTDKRVNMVTEELFKLYPTPRDFVSLDIKQLEPLIKSCGLYHAKAKNIIEACKTIQGEFNGNVPSTMEDLLRLPGVGRKVANVVLSNAFGVPAIAVDTHVFRVTNRLGIANSTTAYGVEKQLMEAIPREQWGKAHHLFIFHGRRCCFAKKPDCQGCKVNAYCKHYNEE